MTDLVTNADVFLLLGISSPTATQTSVMTLIRKGVEASVRSECHWQIDEATFTVYLPYFNQPTVPTVGTANLAMAASALGGYSFVVRGRNRLQLPSPWVKSVASVYVDEGAIAGNGASDFPSSSLLDPDTQYYLEIENARSGGVVFSKSGGLLRVDRSWPSTAGTVKVTYSSGFDADDFAGEQYGLYAAIVSECAAKWVARQNYADPGSNGSIKSERLGDYAVTLAAAEGDDFVVGGGISRTLCDYLAANGYTFFNIGL